MTTVRTALALSLAGSIFALGACSDDDPRPKIAPPESSSPTASATPSSSSSSSSSAVADPAPALPSAAKRRDRAGAKAFSRYWFRLLSFAMETGQTEELAEVSARTCVSCRALIRRVDDIYRKGGRLKTKGWVVELITESPTYRHARPSFLLRIKEERRQLFDVHDRLVDTQGESKFPMRAELIELNRSWAMASLEIIQ